MKIKNIKIFDKANSKLKRRCEIFFPHSECDRKDYHLHKYVSDDGLVVYLPIEQLRYHGFNWTEEIREVSRDEIEIAEFEFKYGLIRIADNLDYLKNVKKNTWPYYEYRYTYTTNEITNIRGIPIEMPSAEWGWTKYKNSSSYGPKRHFTGEYRLVYHAYVAYKIDIDEDSKKKPNYTKKAIVRSSEVGNLMDIKDEYPYIMEDYLLTKYEYLEMPKELLNKK